MRRCGNATHVMSRPQTASPNRELQLACCHRRQAGSSHSTLPLSLSPGPSRPPAHPCREGIAPSSGLGSWPTACAMDYVVCARGSCCPSPLCAACEA